MIPEVGLLMFPALLKRGGITAFFFHILTHGLVEASSNLWKNGFREIYGRCWASGIFHLFSVSIKDGIKRRLPATVTCGFYFSLTIRKL